MKRLLKILAWALGLLVALILVAVIVVPLVIDPNDYRDEINNLVEKQTGRELTIEGDLELSVFPWLGLEIGKTRLGNAPGFGPDPFASIEGADIRVKLLPLLRRKVEVDTIRLNGLAVNLTRNAKGTTNWEDLAGAGEGQKEPAPEPKQPGTRKGAPVAALAVGGLEVRNARISWTDQQANQKAIISELDLTSGEVAPGETFPLALNFRIDSNAPQVAGTVALNTRVTLAPGVQQYRLEQTELTTALNTPIAPGGKLDARLSAATAGADLGSGQAELNDLLLEAFGTTLKGQAKAENITGEPKVAGTLQAEVGNPERLANLLPEGMKPGALKGAGVQTVFDVDLGQETLNVSKLQANALGVRLQGTVEGNKIVSEPRFVGKVTSDEFVPRDITEALGIKLPEMSDASALSKAKLGLDFQATGQKIALLNLLAQFDQSTLKGSGSVANFAAPVIRYDLALDEINVDRYLPPPSEKPEAQAPATPGGAAAGAATQLPLDLLRSLDVDGKFTVGSLKVANLSSKKILTVLKGNNGLFRVNPASAQLYGGGYKGDLTFDVRQDTPRMAMDEKLTGVQSGPLLEDLVGKPYVTGTANLAAKVTARGLEPEQVRQSLSGNASFRFTDGAVKGVAIGEMIRDAYAKAKRQPKPEGQAKDTDFAELQGTLQITNGVVQNNDLSAKSPLLRVTGKGVVNLVKMTVDYLVTATLVSTLEGQGGQEVSDLKGVPIPVRVVGPLDDPKFKVELAKLLEQRAKQAVEREKKKAEEKARKRLEGEQRKAEERAKEQLKQEQKKLEDKLQDRLKGLFK